MATKAKEASSEIQVVQVKRKRLTVKILGTSPILFNCLAEKTRAELLMPSVKKNKVERATTLKHNPYREFRDSADKNNDPNQPTLLQIPSTAFKGALCSAAIDLPGSATRAAIGRLTYVDGDYVGVYGKPKLHMAIVRMADISRTPDVRTRCCLPEWACELTISFVTPILAESAVLNLLAGAGITQGVGDFRTQKGKGNFGSFEMVHDDETEARWQRIVAEGGRAVQEQGMAEPECYDAEAAKLLAWFDTEAERRDFKVTK